MVGTACILVGGAFGLSATSAAQAAATSVSNHKISGNDSAISCMTASRCVAVGYGATSHGQVVVVTNGKQTHVTTVPSTKTLYSVSCPSSAGCWAIGPQNGGANLVLVRIGPAGKVTKALKVAEPFASIGSISCVSMKYCGVLGDNIFVSPAAIEIGTWSGTKLTLHSVAGVKGSTDTVGDGISCWKATCLAVGYYYLKAPNSAGFLLTMNNGKPGKQHTISNDFFYGVSCVSSSRCYADGFSALAAGLVVSVKNGVATHTQMESVDVTGIECVGSTCRASGEKLGGSSYYGVIRTLFNGTNKGTPVVDKAVDGFDGPGTIAARGAGFAAIGPVQKGSGSEVAVG